MKKIYFLCIAVHFLSLNAIAQNVGIGTNTPQTKLDINGALSARITSIAAAGSVTIPENVTLFRLTNTTGGSTTALTVTNPKDGQLLIIMNEDDNPATINGYTIPAGSAANPSVGNFVNIGGIAAGWKSTADNNTGANTFNAGNGLEWSGNTLNSVWSKNGNDIYNNNSSNKVGIGTSTPAGTLEVNGGTAPANNNGNNIIMQAQNGGTGTSVGGSISLTAGTGTVANGIVDINSSGTGNVNIANGTNTQTVNIANENTNTKTVNIGGTSANSAVNIKSGSTGGVNITGNETISGNVIVQGNNVYGNSTGESNTNLSSRGGIRMILDNNSNGSEDFAIQNNNGASNVFTVTEAGSFNANGSGTIDGNLTLTGGSPRDVNLNDAANIKGTSGLDVILDNDANSSSVEFNIKTDGEAGTTLMTVTDAGNVKIPALNNSGTKVVTVDNTGTLVAGTNAGSLVPNTTTLTINNVGNQTTVSPSGPQDLGTNRTWTVGTAQDIAQTSSPTFTDLNLTGNDLNSAGILRVNSTTDVRVSLDTDNNGSNSFDVNNGGGSTVFSVTEGGNVNIPSLTVSSAVYTDGSKNLTTTAPNNGTLGYWTRDNSNGYLAPSTLADKVGIGTATPSDKLDVNGNIIVSNGNEIRLRTNLNNIRGMMQAVESGTTGGFILATSNNENIIFRDNGLTGDLNMIISGSTGNVGIGGITSPATKLDVNGVINAATGYRVAGAAATGTYLRGNGTDYVSSTIQAADLPNGTGNTWQRISTNVSLINSGDLVGVGTTSPGSKLTVIGNIGLGTTGDDLSTSSYTIKAISGASVINSGNGRELFVEAGVSDNNAAKRGGHLYLRPGQPTAPATTYGDIYMADQGGNVSIGNTSPTAMLHVGSASNRNFRVGSNGVTFIRFDDNNAVPMLILENRAMQSAGHGIIQNFGLNINGAAAVTSGQIRVSSEDSYAAAANQDAYMSFATILDGNLNERMRITGAGNVGIGNTPGFKLDVSGVINAATGYRVAGAVASTGTYLRGNGSEFVANTIQAADLPSGIGNAWQRSGTNVTLINSGDNVGVGVGSPTAKLDISNNSGTGLRAQATMTDISQGQTHSLNSTHNLSTNIGVYGVYNGGVANVTAGTGATVFDVFNQQYVNVQNSATLGNSYATFSRNATLGASPTGTISNMFDLYSDVLSTQHTGTANLTITNHYGVFIANKGSGGTGITKTNAYGLYIADQTGATTSNYSLYSVGGTNYFGGNVGIGNPSPSFKLDVTGNARIGATGGLTIASLSASRVNLRPSVSNGDILISDDSQTPGRGLTLANGGNVGIGTDVPAVKLSILSTGADAVHLKANTGGSAPYHVALFTAESNIDYRGRGLFLPSTAAEASASWFAGVPYTGGGFQIGNSSVHSYQDGNGPYVTANAKLFISNTGNVGIGTAGPTTTLDVNGPIRIRGGSPAANSVLTSSDANGNAVWTSPASLNTTYDGSVITSTGTANILGSTTTPTLAQGTYFVVPYNCIPSVSANYYLIYDAVATSGTVVGGYAVYDFSQINSFTINPFVIKVQSATATVNFRVRHGNSGTITNPAANCTGFSYWRIGN